MKDFHLRFADEWPDNGVIDLLSANVDGIPQKPGAYVLGTAGETMLTYPWATSPIFYIGKADNLQRRLTGHKRFTEGAREDYWEKWWWPRYQYGAAFGVSCVWYTSSTDSPAKLEGSLVAKFYEHFGSIPVANTRWPKEPSVGERDE